MSEAERKKELKFLDLSKLCEKISTSQKDKKGNILRKFIDDFRQVKGGKLFYPVMRLLLPHLDRDRGPYGLKEHTLAQKYIKVLSIPKESVDAKKLLNYRAPKISGSASGDFAEVVYWVVKNRHSGGEEFLTIDEVNTHLDKVADKNAGNNPRGVEDVLIWMVQRMSPLEIKWLTRILVKDMKLGIGHKGILRSYHIDAVELYDVSNNLSKICDKLYDPKLRLHEVEVCLFDPFRPMLAERCDVQKLEKELHGKHHVVELKWDGERSQMHYKDGEFKYFSRNCIEYTESFGGSSSIGSLSPHLVKLLNPTCRSFILDGEIMAWNKKNKFFASKGQNIDVKSLRIGSDHQPCFCAFDILYLNGSVLTNKMLKERQSILSTVFTPLEGVFVITKSTEVNTSKEVMKLLNDAIDNRDEGIVLKQLESVYKPNVRKGGWYKIKPEYTEGAMSDLDLLIIGGYYGEGRRRGVVSQFLLGVAIPSDLPGQDPKEFHAVGRVGSGLNMKELDELGQKLNWNNCKKKFTPPDGLYWTKEKPELWIKPCDSVVLQIKASEIVYSDAYPVNYTLRFPRIEKVRSDKRWQDCLTIKEFIELKNAASGKLISSHITEDKSPVKIKRMKMTTVTPSVGHEFLGSDFSKVKSITKLFEGKEICVIIGNEDYSKRDLEAKIVENGGKVFQNPGLSTFFVVSGESKHIRVNNIAKNGWHDVVTVDWFLNCIELKEILNFRPKDLICMSKNTQKKMNLLYDEYGDSYTETATLESLKDSLSKVQKVGKIKSMERCELADFDHVLFNGSSPFAIFRHCTAFFFKYKVGKLTDNVNSPLKIAAANFMFMGGKIVNTIEDNITHVIIHSRIDWIDASSS
ncbi:DNA ligase 4-like isoform X3 [Lycorma delicatula]|uniref:DNA ligase 4-like isoform X3 n=1 Tax=Lycorma delicatula TaxID=130591 RepID=UPI003F51426A